MKAQNACPNRYGKMSPELSCRSVGSSSLRMASRSHMAVSGSSRPTDKYSAIPSTTQRGRSDSPRIPAPDRPCAKLYWNA